MTNSTEELASDDYVVVIGPVIVDRYFVGKPRRLDRTAPVPLIGVTGQFWAPGGGGNAANCLAHLALPTTFVGMVGDDDAGEEYLKAPMPPNLQLKVGKYANYSTPVKTRVYANNRLVARFDADDPYTGSFESTTASLFFSAVAEKPPLAILISDYNKGVCTPDIIGSVLLYGEDHNVPVIVDPDPAHTESYQGATLLTPNADEAMRMAAACGYADRATDPVEAADFLANKFDCDVLVTLGSHGMVLVPPHGQERFPLQAMPAASIDTCGCGDAVASAMTYGIATGMNARTATRFANVSGSLCCEIIGAMPIPLHRLNQRVTLSLGLDRKVVTLDELRLLRQSVAVAGEIFGVANGVFDGVHDGHTSLLRQAREHCDFLAVLVNTDESAERIKRRPQHSQIARSLSLAAHPLVDAVLLFDGDNAVPEYQALQPDIMVKGPDYKDREDLLPEAAVLPEWGGELRLAELEVDVSSTQLREEDEALKESTAPGETEDSAGGAGDAAD